VRGEGWGEGLDTGGWLRMKGIMRDCAVVQQNCHSASDIVFFYLLLHLPFTCLLLLSTNNSLLTNP